MLATTMECTQECMWFANHNPKEQLCTIKEGILTLLLVNYTDVTSYRQLDVVRHPINF